MIIGILQTGRVSEALKTKHGDFPDMMQHLLEGKELSFQTFAVIDGIFPDTVADCDGWLVTGSSHSAYEDSPWIRRLEQFLRDAYEAGVPIVGICFGHQLLAQALGGTVRKAGQGWGIGPMEYEFAGGQATVINAWHQDQVVELPPEATRIATSSFCENAALIYKKRALTYQAHPEFTSDFIRDLVDLRRETLPADVTRCAEKSMEEMQPSRHVAEQIANFFRHNTINVVSDT